MRGHTFDAVIYDLYPLVAVLEIRAGQTHLGDDETVVLEVPQTAPLNVIMLCVHLVVSALRPRGPPRVWRWRWHWTLQRAGVCRSGWAITRTRGRLHRSLYREMGRFELRQIDGGKLQRAERRFNMLASDLGGVLGCLCVLTWKILANNKRWDVDYFGCIELS